ncbi:hypothetical protein [Nocardiopsis sp. NPDC006938]|uniref:hypothetical protein n=1 Tax=Nocardiopsis sp. NPDC006938 TaxID=3364337 RepID=UPI00368013E7
MTPAKPSVRRALVGGTLFVALGALGVVAALPASADQLVWANAQARVADGDLVSGHSEALGFGVETEDAAPAEPAQGPLSAFTRITGEGRTLVNDRGALSQTVVERATVRIGVDDLVGLGLVDPGQGRVEVPGQTPSPEPEPDSAPPGVNDDGAHEREDTGQGPRQAERPTPDAPFHDPSEEPGASPSEDDTVALGEGASETVSADANAIEFSLTDVRTSAAAAYDGSTETTFEYGELSAFGVPVADFDGDHRVEETLEVLDERGDTRAEVPVSIRFVAVSEAFDDEDEDWEGEGVRSALTVSVVVGDPELGQGFTADLADSWAIGSTHIAPEAPGEGERGEGERETSVASQRLATTGSSLAALVTAAVVAVGGGATATFLARKRTTAMDDQIED